MLLLDKITVNNIDVWLVLELDEKNQMKNDIAILKLASPLDLGRPEVKSLSVNTNPSCPVADSLCRVTGWGDTTGRK